jgi:hypothetical protein
MEIINFYGLRKIIIEKMVGGGLMQLVAMAAMDIHQSNNNDPKYKKCTEYKNIQDVKERIKKVFKNNDFKLYFLDFYNDDVFDEVFQTIDYFTKEQIYLLLKKYGYDEAEKYPEILFSKISREKFYYDFLIKELDYHFSCSNVEVLRIVKILQKINNFVFDSNLINKLTSKISLYKIETFDYLLNNGLITATYCDYYYALIHNISIWNTKDVLKRVGSFIRNYDISKISEISKLLMLISDNEMIIIMNIEYNVIIKYLNVLNNNCDSSKDLRRKFENLSKNYLKIVLENDYKLLSNDLLFEESLIPKEVRIRLYIDIKYNQVINIFHLIKYFEYDCYNLGTILSRFIDKKTLKNSENEDPVLLKILSRNHKTFNDDFNDFNNYINDCLNKYDTDIVKTFLAYFVRKNGIPAIYYFRYAEDCLKNKHGLLLLVKTYKLLSTKTKKQLARYLFSKDVLSFETGSEYHNITTYLTTFSDDTYILKKLFESMDMFNNDTLSVIFKYI